MSGSPVLQNVALLSKEKEDSTFALGFEVPFL